MAETRLQRIADLGVVCVARASGAGLARCSIPQPHSQILQAFYNAGSRYLQLNSTLRVGDIVFGAAFGTALVFLNIPSYDFGSVGSVPLSMVALLTIITAGATGWEAILVALEHYRLKVARPYLSNDVPVVNNAPMTTGRGGEEGDYGQARRSIPQILQAFFDTIDRLQQLDSTLRVGDIVFGAAFGTALVFLDIPSYDFGSVPLSTVALLTIVTAGATGWEAILVALEYYRLKVARPYLSFDMPVGNNAPTTTRRGGEEGDDSVTLTEQFAKLNGPKQFCYEELMIMTNSFADGRILGRGGFGIVYEGHVEDARTRVAVKIINTDSHQGRNEYVSEVKSLSQLRHRNLVQLIGYCHEANKFVLVYEFIGGGSLEDHLFRGRSLLTWEMRDIKSSNIMLNERFEAKLGDFGLARLVDHARGRRTTEVIGTWGYAAPEYLETGEASKESDVYSFGVVLLEIACGRSAVDAAQVEQVPNGLVKWVWKRYGRRSWNWRGRRIRSWRGRRNFLLAVDERLGKDFDKKQAEALMITGLWCAHPIAGSRPSIEAAMAVLNSKADPPKLPPKMPSFNT